MTLAARKRARTKSAQNCFSIVLSPRPSPALSFFKLIEVGTNFLFANSVSEFPRSQDPQRTCDQLLRALILPRVVDFPWCRSGTDGINPVGGRRCSRLQIGSKNSACPSTRSFLPKTALISRFFAI